MFEIMMGMFFIGFVVVAITYGAASIINLIIIFIEWTREQ